MKILPEEGYVIGMVQMAYVDDDMVEDMIISQLNMDPAINAGHIDIINGQGWGERSGAYWVECCALCRILLQYMWSLRPDYYGASDTRV
jgi:hypothetical protein